MLTRLLAFLRKDLIVESSYKAMFLSHAASAFLPILVFYFIGKMVEDQNHIALKRFDTDFFSYTLIGLAVTQYLALSMASFGQVIARQQAAGCLEAILSSKTSPMEVVLLSPAFSFLSKGVYLIGTMMVGWLFFGLNLNKMNAAAALVVGAASASCFVSLGILSAAFIIRFKRGDPIGWIAGAASSILGGAFFPVELLPQWLQGTSKLLPFTHSIEALRLAILKGEPVGALWSELQCLIMFTLLMFPLGLLACSWAIEQGRRDGTLMHH